MIMNRIRIIKSKCVGAPLGYLVSLTCFVTFAMASYTNGKSRYSSVPFQGCNYSTNSVPESAVPSSQEEESHPETTTGTTTLPQVNSQQNKYFSSPTILGPLGTSLFRPPVQEYYPVPTIRPSLYLGNRLAQLQQSVMTYRNQITGNRFFELSHDPNTIRFLMYTRKNPSSGQRLMLHNKETLEGNGFQPDKPTKLIIHGFSEIGAMGEWVTNLRDAYLSTSDSNVVVADFSAFETFLLFWTNLPLFAANKIAELVQFMEVSGGTKRELFHIIARSYGTHVAGVAGRLLQGRVGRITGLEPEPKVYGTTLPDYKLVSSDAQFVDVSN